MKRNIDISVVFITVKDLFYFILFLPSGRCTIIKHAATDMEMMEFDVYLAQKKKKNYFFTPYAPTNSTCINLSLVSQIILCLIYCNNNNIE